MAGKPAAPINITPVVLPTAQLPRIDVTPRQLYAVMLDKHEWLQWLARHHVIRNNVDCGTCKQSMVLVARRECNDSFLGIVTNATPAIASEPGHSLPTASHN